MSKKEGIRIDFSKVDHLTDILLGVRHDPLKTPIFEVMELKKPKGFEND